MDTTKINSGIGKAMININKIVIVGGGSAGWMSAAAMIKTFPEKEIICIESPDFPTVGVGESTIGGIKLFTSFLGINEKDFLRHTEGTYKLSIKFTDFYEKGSGSFHYPFGVPYLEGTEYGLQDWYFKKYLYPETPLSNYAYTFYPAVAMCEKNKFSDNKSGTLSGWRKDLDVAYHFDATKFGQWLKNNYCIPRGVNLISDTVTKIFTNDEGVDYLVLSSGEKIKADLFIDCTGFKSLLIEKELNSKWLDYSHMLPNNRAWATRIPYTDKEKELEPYTNCTAIENGWVWNIPSWKRIGTGYVYSDKYVSPEQALSEFKNYLKSDYMTVPDKERDVESFEYKDVKFRVGIHEKTFIKNVVAIGLAAGFIEPLESNGLYTAHEFLLKLSRTLSRGKVSQNDIDMYNYVTKSMFDTFATFVSMHYSLSARQDTQYWKDISARSFDKKMEDPKIYRNYANLAENIFTTHSTPKEAGIGCITTGLNHLPIDDTIASFFELSDPIRFKKIHNIVKMWEKIHAEWEHEAEISPTLYKYLKDYVYNE